jgi:hypothetical protein
MSTLNVTNAQITTLKDASGGNSSIPADVFEGRAKAWLHFNGVGTPAIVDNFNITSITDNAAADYTVNFASALANANYCIVTGNGSLASGSGHAHITLNRVNATGTHVDPTTGAFRLTCADAAGTTTENKFIYAAVFCGA